MDARQKKQREWEKEVLPPVARGEVASHAPVSCLMVSPKRVSCQCKNSLTNSPSFFVLLFASPHLFLYQHKPSQKEKTMASPGKTFLLVVLLTAATMMEKAECGCFDDLSRCTGWTTAASGVLWQSCHDHCRSQGRNGGECVQVDNTCWFLPASVKVRQCQCN
ncbi:unnamed protein product [Darwinula stevensoni]|uniref:Theromacin n=1 Tax=Darwinula stevensoni TaxID=69355 RepID=A0A7R8XCW4_9CRUS|nr:unnamed protein product [Darwinula stevensoni]CAG0894136.1 unnamed protein product [Darwinula stevensoni]